MQARVQPIQSQQEYEDILFFLRQLLGSENVDQEPHKCLWAKAALYAAEWQNSTILGFCKR